MFTGITQEVGDIQSISRYKSYNRLEIYAPEVSGFLKLGDSISVDGVCFTVSAKKAKKIFVETTPETIKKSIAGQYCPGQKVNLELPLYYGDKISGHFVTGHVDCKGKIINISNIKNDNILKVSYPSRLKKYLALKGSVTINGVSLTVTKLSGKKMPKSNSKTDKETFEVNLIPFTLRNTNLGSLKKTSYVNIEIDILARYGHILSSHENIQQHSGAT